MKEISVCPSTLREGFSTYSEQAVRDLFDGRRVSHIFRGNSPENDNGREDAFESIGRISLSGVQPKFSVYINENSELAFTPAGVQGHYILKPRPTGYHLINKDYCAANEHFTMQLASQVYGIQTAVNGLCFFEDNFQAAYLTRRFDVKDNGKYKQEDFSALLGLNKYNGGSNYKYDKVSYEDCAAVITRYVKVSLVDLRRFFRLILFNFLTLNDDAHIKNFSLIQINGEYRLAPAYDLINTSLHLHEPRIFALEKGLFREGMSFSDTRWINRKDFEEFGSRLGLPVRVIKKDLDFFSHPKPEAKALLSQSFLSDDLKRKYWDSYDFRRKMLTF